MKTKSLQVIETGTGDNIDVISSYEMLNILGGTAPILCTNGYCRRDYSCHPLTGVIVCGCDYVAPIPGGGTGDDKPGTGTGT